MTITTGLLTYGAEGCEGGPYHSRKLHVPSARSGLTIGRGYDMKEKSANKINQDLLNAGVSKEFADLLAPASGLYGASAEQFIEDHQLSDLEISTECQEHLFTLSYQEMTVDVQRICDKDDCIAAYGDVDWAKLNPAIKEVVIDLRFRGDYTPKSRQSIQPHLVDNNLSSFTALLKNRSLWKNVPEDRFKRRMYFLLDGLVKQNESA
jgi:hypothetical protein